MKYIVMVLCLIAMPVFGAYLNPDQIAVPAADSTDNDYVQEAVGNKSDTAAGDSLISLTKIVDSVVDGNYTALTGIDDKVDDILLDTGTTIPSRLDTVDTANETNYTELTGITDSTSKILTDTGTTIPGTITTLDGKVETNWTLITGIDSNIDDVLTDTGTTLPSTITDYSGMATAGRAVTATLYVSPNGDGSDGTSWGNAYTSIQAALTAASTDVNECTLILIGINTGSVFYDIDTTGDPEFTGNYILQGTHRTWAKIKNNHAGATSILKFTGYTSLQDLNWNLGTDNNGVIMTKGAFRVECCQFVGEDLEVPKTALHLDGASALKHGQIGNTDFKGNKDYMTGLLVDNVTLSDFHDNSFTACTTAIQMVNAGSDCNKFRELCISGNGIGIDIDAGNELKFNGITLDGNDSNIDDEVGDALWNNINGEFPIYIYPENLTGDVIAAGDGTWGADTDIVATDAIDAPFKIISYSLQPSDDENTLIRFSANGGSTFFGQDIFATKRDKATGGGTATDYIFNKGTRISASAWSPVANRTINIWLELQEI